MAKKKISKAKKLIKLFKKEIKEANIAIKKGKKEIKEFVEDANKEFEDLSGIERVKEIIADIPKDSDNKKSKGSKNG